MYIHTLTDGGTDGVVVSRVDEDVEPKAPIDQVVVYGRRGDGVAVRGVVADLVAAGGPSQCGLHMHGGFHVGAVQGRVGIIVRTWLVAV